MSNFRPPPIQEAEGGIAWTQWFNDVKEILNILGSINYVVFDGSGATGTKNQDKSTGVSSVVKNSTGNYTITFDKEFNTSSYAILGTADVGPVIVVSNLAASVTVTSTNGSGVATDANLITVIAFGDKDI